MPYQKLSSSKNGQLLKVDRVFLSYDGIANVGHTKPSFTDNNGRALIEHSSSGMATVYIDNKDMVKYALRK